MEATVKYNRTALFSDKNERDRRYTMYVIAGLGNPGSKYEKTRHNVGFQVIDRLASKYHIDMNTKKHKAICGTGVIEGVKVLLVKPQTFMNLSGESIREAVDYYKIDPEDIIVIYDDISLEPGQLRIRLKGSAGGHNGIKNIIAHAGTQNFMRIKVGVGAKPEGWDLADHVLGRFKEEDRKLVEIVKATYFDPKIVVIDETTTALSQEGREELYKHMERIKKSGNTVIFISHDLPEILDKSDTITILRDGVYIDTVKSKDVTEDDLKKLMVGREVTGDYYRADYGEKVSDEVVLSVKNVTVPGLIEDVTFDLHKGEILGFGGLSESGMHEIGKAIFGASYDRTGSVTLADGTQINDIPTAIKHSIAYTSKDRDNESVVLNQSIGDNICLPSLDELAGKSHLLSDKKRKEFADKYAKQMSVKMVDVNQFVSNLSGGNKQKVVLARWIGKDSDIVVLDSPTRGIDIKVKQDIYQLMNQMRKNGKSIIMISEELMELIGMSDRIIIMKDGKISGELERNQNLDENGLISMMV